LRFQHFFRKLEGKIRRISDNNSTIFKTQHGRATASSTVMCRIASFDSQSFAAD